MSAHALSLGPLGRLGRWSAHHARIVFVAWVVIAVGLGFLAPRVEHSLSGAGWEATGSESVEARDLVSRAFNGADSTSLMVVVHSTGLATDAPAFRDTLRRATDVLRADPAVSGVMQPRPGMTISRDGHTAILTGTSARNPKEMVRAADRLKGPLRDLGSAEVSVNLTGASGMWSDFNEANRSAMMKSELFSWPVTLAILVVAFGSLVAASLPLLLTIVGLVASAGVLYLGTLAADISIWAMNFALMFALALGIDYALFIVVRYRAAHFGGGMAADDAAGVAMDTAGKAVLFSGVTVLISLSAVLLVPSPAFRSMALGIMVAVVFILAATMTLLPAVLGALGSRVDRLSLRWVHQGEHRSPAFARWAERIWSKPLLYGLPALLVLLALAAPVLGLRTGMPSIAVVPHGDSSREGYAQVQEAFGPGAPGTLQVVAPTGDAAAAATVLTADRGIAAAMPGVPSADGTWTMIQAVPATDPSDTGVGRTIDRLRGTLPAGSLVGGAPAENHDLEVALADATPIVIGVVLALGFLLLLVALQAPVVALVGVVTNLLATAAAFGVARLVFQEGHLASLLGFESQGFLDAWGPVFFFAMIFAIAMDYTVFLLASAKEHLEHSGGDVKDAMVGGLAHSGRVILAAAAVMVAVFFTFALSGPLPPKEMGIILGVAVALDAFLVRLLLVPVALRLLGPAAWWTPAPLRRMLPSVSFGHGHE
ncbi:MAG: MMPL family transporter [Thermoleophilia bacterium]|nr:MMPL family transporter [Thermoleophilia bacterium]